MVATCAGVVIVRGGVFVCKVLKRHGLERVGRGGYSAAAWAFEAVPWLWTPVLIHHFVLFVSPNGSFGFTFDDTISCIRVESTALMELLP